MSDDYLELFLTWASTGEHPTVKSWLENHGLSSRRMTNGLLVSGDRQTFEKAFSVSLQSVRGPYELPIPPELAPHVASLILPRPRSYDRDWRVP